MTVTLRPAADADRPAIFNVHARAIRETCSRAYAPEQIAVWLSILSPEYYTPLVRKRVMMVAADGDEIVGFAQLDPVAGQVDAVYVRPDRQGKGIGRRLLAELEEQALARGLRKLCVSATLNAADFYARAGYARRRRTVHRMLSGAELPCIWMGKTLDVGKDRAGKRRR